MQTVYNIYIA